MHSPMVENYSRGIKYADHSENILRNLKRLTQGQMLKQNIVQKQIAWARSLLTVSILITQTDDVSNECKPLWLGYNS